MATHAGFSIKTPGNRNASNAAAIAMRWSANVARRAMCESLRAGPITVRESASAAARAPLASISAARAAMRSLSFRRRCAMPENRLSPGASAASDASAGTASGKSVARMSIGTSVPRAHSATTSEADVVIRTPIRSRTGNARASASADGHRNPLRETRPPADPTAASIGIADE